MFPSTLMACLGLALIQVLFFHDNLFGWSYTGWDTHDWIFVNFLYLSDTIRNSGIPLWNHFIQSGNFLPSFNNTGLYTLFYAPFIAASWVMNSMRSFELMIQVVILIGATGTYLFFKARCVDRLVAFLGATFYSLALLMPITGQLAFVFSFASLPWMLILATTAVMRENKIKSKFEFAKTLILPISIALFIASGYVWLNFVNFLVAFSWGLALIYTERANGGPISQAKIAAKLVGALGLVGILYLMLIGPGLMNLLNSYSIFNGDFISPEPRMRGLSPVQNYSYGNIISAIFGIIDPRFATKWPEIFQDIRLTWSYGVGLVVFLLAFLLPGGGKKSDKYWWMLFVVFLLYSVGNSYGIDKVIRRLPVLNANRWWFVGAYYCSIALIMIAIFKLDAYFKASDAINHRARMLICLGVLLLCATSTVGHFRYLSVAIAALIYLLLYFRRQRKVGAVILLLAFSVLEFLTLRGTSDGYKFSSVPDAGDYYRMVDARNRETTITKNYRKLSDSKDYVFYDVDWFLHKIPIAHGYNHIGNPLYWFLKNDGSIGKIAFIGDGLRVEKNISRVGSENDNVFATELTNDVLENPLTPTVSGQNFDACKNSDSKNGNIKSIAIRPNDATMVIETTGPAFLVFNNVYYRGWSASIDGQEVPINIANRIFMGVCIDRPGVHSLDFSFRPLRDILLLSFPNLLLLALMLLITGYKIGEFRKRSPPESRGDETAKAQ